MRTIGSPRRRGLLVATTVGALVACGACDDARRLLGTPDISLRVVDTSCPTATVGWGDGSADDPRDQVSLPWERSIGSPAGLVLVLAAARDCDDDGTVTVEIRLDGRLEDRGEATGPGAVAAASTSFF